MINQVKTDKKSLEEELNMFSETKQAMSKYDWQISEILQMVNEEKQVRSHLKTLASKLIEEVDTLRSQTTSVQNSNINNNNNNPIAAAQLSASVVNGSNPAVIII